LLPLLVVAAIRKKRETVEAGRGETGINVTLWQQVSPAVELTFTSGSQGRQPNNFECMSLAPWPEKDANLKPIANAKAETNRFT